MAERVSVVATVRNERSMVPAFLSSLLGQSRPAEEIVIVDGGSDDGTYELLRRLADTSPTMKVDRLPGSNISEGRNHAVRLASGSVIAVTDGGTVADADWLAELIAPFECGHGADQDVVSGYFRPGGRTRFERVLGAIITPHVREIEPETFLPSSRSVAFTRACFDEVGGYPEWLTHCEDLVLDLELRRRGARFAFRPGAVVTWTTRSSLAKYFRQYFLYARGDGHAGLWPRRHALRYTAYLTGAALALARADTVSRLALATGGIGYLSKFYRRAWRHLGWDRDLAAAVGLVPVVVVTGDVAKMLGYPVGRLRRRRAAMARR